MQKTTKERNLMLIRGIVALFAVLVAAGHLAYTGGSFGGTPSLQASSGTSNMMMHAPGPGGAGGFNAMSFWFDVEVIVYTVIAIVFLLGLRTWYPLSIAFNTFNLLIYFLSGVTAIPGATSMAFPGRFDITPGLSAINIIIFGWVVILLLGLYLWKYDKGSGVDRLLKAGRKERTGFRP